MALFLKCSNIFFGNAVRACPSVRSQSIRIGELALPDPSCYSLRCRAEPVSNLSSRVDFHITSPLKDYANYNYYTPDFSFVKRLVAFPLIFKEWTSWARVSVQAAPKVRPLLQQKWVDNYGQMC